MNNFTIFFLGKKINDDISLSLWSCAIVQIAATTSGMKKLRQLLLLLLLLLLFLLLLLLGRRRDFLNTDKETGDLF